jgi:hypothetical protein
LSFTKFSAVNNWGFERIQCGPEKGAYRHPSFVRGAPHLCQHVKRRTCPSELRKKLSSKKARSLSSQDDPSHSSATLPGPFPTPFPRFVSSERTKNFGVYLHEKYSQMNSANAIWHTLIAPSNNGPNHFVEHMLPADVFDSTRGMDVSVRDGECVAFEGKSFFYVAEDEDSVASKNLRHNHDFMRSSSVVTPRPWSAGRDTFDALLEML